MQTKRRAAEAARQRMDAALEGLSRLGARRAEPEPAAPMELLASPRRRFDLRHVGVVAVLGLLGLLGTLWWLNRSVETTVPVTAVPVSAPVVVPTGVATPTPTPRVGLLVHVLGAVQRPGVVELPAGARVQAAIESAGGLRRDADPALLNLAAPVVDGMQIIVGTTKDPKGELRLPGGGDPGSVGTGLPGKVNLNSATAAQLETLPGVGPATAQAILAWRSKNGSFTRVEELQEVDGIGPKTLAKLAPLVEV